MLKSFDFVLHREFLTTVIKYSILSGVSFFAFTWFFNRLEPINSDQKKSAKKKGSQKLEILGKNKLKLNEHELLIASSLVVPDDVDTTWSEIAGLERIIEEIKDTVIFPITNSEYLRNSKLTKPPKGVLLHGPPGCGKTLIAKATAKEAAASFINLDISMLTDKWYGESQKLVSAAFSLAEKLQPCIIFIDEIDSLLRMRSSQDHEATAMMKTQFMLLWDGICSDPEKMIIVMGATNRPQDIDPAILRRMPAVFKISRPNEMQRKKILQLILSSERCEGINFDYLAKNTASMSGSDLKEVCRIGSHYRMKEYMNKWRNNIKSAPSTHKDPKLEELRPITMNDLQRALDNFKSEKSDF